MKPNHLCTKLLPSVTSLRSLPRGSRADLSLYWWVLSPTAGVSGDLVAEDLEHQRRELHAVLGLEGEAAVLLGVLLVQAP